MKLIFTNQLNKFLSLVCICVLLALPVESLANNGTDDTSTEDSSEITAERSTVEEEFTEEEESDPEVLEDKNEGDLESATLSSESIEKTEEGSLNVLSVEESGSTASSSEEDVLSSQPQSTTTLEVTSVASSTSSSTNDLSSGTDISSSTDDEDIHEQGTTTIETGDAVSTINLLSLLNTNVVNSEGQIILLDLFGNRVGHIDLRNATGTCSLGNCSADGVVVEVENNANIENTILLTANSGGNEIKAGGEAAIITTGDAYANANLINIANVNLVDSSYLLAILNIFSDVNGDIVLPSLVDYLMSEPTSGTIESVNQATIDNNVDLNSSTGENIISDSDNSTIFTGSSLTSLGLINQLNSTLVGGTELSLLLRIAGTWTGEVFGLPPGVEMIRVNGGYVINFNGASLGVDSESLSVYATNTAAISNTVAVSANTGDNQIDNANTSLISTGYAYAGVNIINIANANVIGRNWLLGIININGDFNGNLAFGRPDIWVGGTVNIPRHPENNDTVTYTYTVTNRGDSVASEVMLEDKLSEFIKPLSGTEGYASSTHTLLRSLGTLDPGETTTVTYEAMIEGTRSGDAIKNIVVVEEKETDNDETDNTEIVTFYTSSGGGSQTKTEDDEEPEEIEEKETDLTESGVTNDLNLKREPYETTLNEAGEIVTQVIRLRNTSDQHINNVVFSDSLYAEDGSRVLTEVWDLGTILPSEEIVLTYDVSFNESANSGVYYFTSVAENEQGVLTIDRSGKLNYDFIEPTVAGIDYEAVNSVASVYTEDDGETDEMSGFDLPPSLFDIAEAQNLTSSEAESSNVISSTFRLAFELFFLFMLLYVIHRIFNYRKDWWQFIKG